MDTTSGTGTPIVPEPTAGTASSAGTTGGTTGGTAPLSHAEALSEVRRLRRGLQRERARRVAAESLGERATRDLYDSVRQLRVVQGELLERAELGRVVTEVARDLRLEVASGDLIDKAAEMLARVTAADRCAISLLEPHPSGMSDGLWVAPDRNLPGTVRLPELPGPLRALLDDAGRARVPLQIDALEDDERIDAFTAAAVREVLGVLSMLAIPIVVADRVAGWISLYAVRPRAWAARDISICEGLSHDLITTVEQARAFAQQRESVARLQELDAAKDAFISNVSHELRTPLTSIVGYLELFSDGGMGDLSEEASAGLAIVGRNVSRLRALVEDLLSLSAYDAATGRRGDRGGRPVDLAAIVVECLQSMRPTIAASGLAVSMEIDPTLGDVNGDVVDFERVTSNLVGNAVKFTPSGGRISVQLLQQRGMAVLVVADDGIGIPQAEQGQLFSRFFRSSLAVADEIQGTGLGLALVRGIVEAYGGTIGVDSVEGEGTSVTVRLPLSP